MLGSALGTSSSSKTINPGWYDPLGPVGFNKAGKPVYSPTGGIPQRNDIFGQMDYLRPVLNNNSQQAATALQSAAANPGYKAATNLANNEIAGNYLNGSPQLDAAMAQMRAGANAGAADTNARIQSQFARNGMSFGTANQEAQQSNQAQTTAGANQAEAQARLQNYQTERANQNAAPAMLDQSLSSPINYLAAIPNEYLGPMSQMAQIVSGLSTGGQIVQPDTMVTPGPTTQLAGALGSL